MPLWDKRLTLISGKGGVGKTTVALALALRAAGEGLRTIICEVGEHEKIAPLMGKPPAGYRETEVAPNLSTIYLNPHESFAEYIKKTLRIEALYRPIIESSLFKQFSVTAPGFKEVMTLGKIMDMERQTRSGGAPLYDRIIVDAPATGHGLAFFKTAITAMNGARGGPVHKNAKKIVELLRDPKRTRMHIVTLAEEMPVNEALEMIPNVRSELGVALGDILINAVESSDFTEKEAELLSQIETPQRRAAMARAFAPAPPQALFAAARQNRSRAALARQYIDSLRARADLPAREIPLFHVSPWGMEGVRRVAEALGGTSK